VGASSPESASRLLERLLALGDVEAILDLYEDYSVFADLEGAVEGPAAIAAAHRRFLDSGLTLELRESVTLRAEEIALVHWSWTVRCPDGSSFEGTSAEVMRRQPDGSWKFVIDNSDGPALIGRL
jgi:ketosteroid isomerase-like protein